MADKIRILFVDDQANILDGLRRMLRSHKNEWDMCFATGGSEALQFLSEHRVDILVTDMKMPGINGAELLDEVRIKYPDTARFVLSGYVDREMALQSVMNVHRYLSKPCNADDMIGVLEGNIHLRTYLNDPTLTSFISEIGCLPSLPETYLKLQKAMRSSSATLDRVGRIIERDMALSSKILQIVNSSFFGLARHVSGPREAVKLLGLDIVRALMIQVSIVREFDQKIITMLSLDELWDHALLSGTFAKEIAVMEKASNREKDYAFVAGLLHDIGILILAANFPSRYSRVLDEVRERGILFAVSERKEFGVDHGQVGAFLLGLWGLPDPVVEAVAFHHSPFIKPLATNDGNFSALTAVHVADVLEHDLDDEGRLASDATLDYEYLSMIGIDERVPHWRERLIDIKSRSKEKNGGRA